MIGWRKARSSQGQRNWLDTCGSFFAGYHLVIAAVLFYSPQMGGGLAALTASKELATITR